MPTGAIYGFMSKPEIPRYTDADNKLLQKVLPEFLSDYFQAPCVIRRMIRRVSEYRSSFAIEVLSLELEDGTSLEIIFKNMASGALLKDARRFRPGFLHDPKREIDVYQKILSRAELGTATCYGSITDETSGRFWLFLEKVPALELYQVGDFEAWLEAARWLARMHLKFSESTGKLAREVSLLQYDRAYYGLWFERAQSFLNPHSKLARQVIRRLSKNYDRVIERLSLMPETLLHGDFYASNILAREYHRGFQICPIDWEMAALGPGLIDLAALTSGKWSQQEVTSMALAYQDVLTGGNRTIGDQELFLEDMVYCQIHVALRWLGWSAQWSPPVEHHHDWLSDILRYADVIDL